MLHHHKHALKQTLGSFIVISFTCVVLFLVLKPNMNSIANEKQAYVPTEGISLSLPDEVKVEEPAITNKEKSKSPSNYTVQPQGLPLLKVTSVVDGNTVILEGMSRIILVGIKSPDVDEEYGIEAADYLKFLVEGKEIYFQLDDKNPRDDLGRLRGIVYMGKKNINIEMLKAGMAHIFPTTPSIVGYDDWSSFENEAREAKRGLWSGEKPKAIEKSMPSL
jgi:endonuclease YncB( thermonuclease family)